MNLGKSSEHTGKSSRLTFINKPVLHFILIAVIGLLAYSNTFEVPFVFDDENTIADNQVIRSLDNFLLNSSGYYYIPGRFIGYLSFAINYRLGGLDVVGYHVVNLAVHIVNALLIYYLVRLTFRTPHFRNAGCGTRNFVALLAALLFVAHPIQTQAVTYIVQRLTSLASLFYLLALVLYTKARLSLGARGTGREEEDRGEGGKAAADGTWFAPLLLYAGSLLSAVLAMRTKEIAFTLPLVVLLYEFCFFRGSPWKRLAMLLPMLGTLLIIPLSMLNARKPVAEILSDVSDATMVQTDLSRWDYLLTQSSVIATYVRLLFLPVNQNLDYDYPIYSSFLEPRVLLSSLFLLTLFGIAVYLFHRSTLETRNSKLKTQNSQSAVFRLIAFGIFWFFITLAVESSVIPIVDVIYEHRVYLPSVGAFVAAAAFAMVLERYSGTVGRKITAPAAILIIIMLAVATWQRNQVWRDPVTLWQDCFSKAPGKARVNYNLGTQLASRGRVDEAIVFFQRAIQQRPTSTAYNNLGSAYQTKGEIEQAIQMYQRAISMQKDNAEAYYNLGTAYLTLQGRDNEAISLLFKALKHKPDYDDAYINLAAAYNKVGRFRDAIALLEGRKSRLQGRADARFNLGVAYHCLGDAGAAAGELTALRGLDPGYAARLADFLAKPYVRPRTAAKSKSLSFSHR